jgi:hypothetical protein
MQRDPGASTAADPAQRGVESDPRRWPARSLACAPSIEKPGLRTPAKDGNGPFADRHSYSFASEAV